MTEHPFVLKRLMASRQERAIEGNSCDNRPTYQYQLDEITARCEQLYENGQRLVATLSAKDLERCAKLYRLRHGRNHSIYDLAETRIEGTWVLVLPHVALIEEVRSLREALS